MIVKYELITDYSIFDLTGDYNKHYFYDKGTIIQQVSEPYPCHSKCHHGIHHTTTNASFKMPDGYITSFEIIVSNDCDCCKLKIKELPVQLEFDF